MNLPSKKLTNYRQSPNAGTSQRLHPALDAATVIGRSKYFPFKFNFIQAISGKNTADYHFNRWQSMIIWLCGCNSSLGQLVANVERFIIVKCKNVTTADSETFLQKDKWFEHWLMGKVTKYTAVRVRKRPAFHQYSSVNMQMKKWKAFIFHTFINLTSGFNLSLISVVDLNVGSLPSYVQAWLTPSWHSNPRPSCYEATLLLTSDPLRRHGQ